MNQKRQIRIKTPQVIPPEHTIPSVLSFVQLSDEERRAQVWERRLKGYSYEAIAREMREQFSPDSLPKNWSAKTVYADCAAILAQIRDEYRESAAEIAGIELSRYDELQNSIWESAKSGDIRAITTVLEISRERRKLLGLDNPAKYEVSWVAQLGDFLQKGVITPQEIADEFGDEGLSTVNRYLLEKKGN